MVSTDRLNGLTASAAVKAPCKAAALSNITLSGEQTVNGVAVVSGDRVLVSAQTDSKENGIYVVDTSEWDRAADFDGNRDVRQGTLVVVNRTSAQNYFYQVDTADPIVIGTSEIEFSLTNNLTVTHDRTPNEITNGVVPADTQYLPGYAVRYGAAGDGVADDSSALQDALDADAGIFVLEKGKNYKIDSDVTGTNDVAVYGNGATISGSGVFSLKGSASNVGRITAAAAKGDESIVVDDAGSIAVGSLIEIRNTVDSSFDPYSTLDRDGEFKIVRTVSGTTISTTEGLETAYTGAVTDLVDLVSPIRVYMENLTISGTGADVIQLQYLSDSKIVGVRATGGTQKAFELTSCYNVCLENCRGFCNGASASLQYGLSISQCQNVTVDGGRFHGTRHGSSIGSSGRIPSRYIIVQNAELSNDDGQSGGADFHSIVANSAYINCRIHGDTKLAGRDNRYEGCKITARRDNAALGYLNLSGGTCGYYNCKVDFQDGFNFTNVIRDINSSVSRDQTADTKLEFVNIEIECVSALLRIGFHNIAQNGNVDTSFYYRNFVLTGDVSGLTEFCNLAIQTSSNPGGFSPAPAAPNEVQITNVVGFDLNENFTWVAVSTGSASTTRFTYPNRKGTWTPTLTTDGTDFDSVTYNASTTGSWRRVDDLIYIEGFVSSNAVTVGSASGSLCVGGLPFTVGASVVMGGITVVTAGAFTGEVPMELAPDPATKRLLMRYRTTAPTDSTSSVVADVDTSTENANRVQFGGWYITSDQ